MKVKDVMHKGVDWVAPDTPIAEVAKLMRKHDIGSIPIGENDDLIGELPVTWNYLVNEYDYREDAKNVHFTDGGPYFEEYKNDDYAEEWFAARERLLFVQQRA